MCEALLFVFMKVLMPHFVFECESVFRMLWVSMCLECWFLGLGISGMRLIKKHLHIANDPKHLRHTQQLWCDAMGGASLHCGLFNSGSNLDTKVWCLSTRQFWFERRRKKNERSFTNSAVKVLSHIQVYSSVHLKYILAHRMNLEFVLRSCLPVRHILLDASDLSSSQIKKKKKIKPKFSVNARLVQS